MINWFRGLLVAGFLVASSEGMTETTYTILDFQDLDGWQQDDHSAALSTFRNTCADLDAPDWRSLCAAASEFQDAQKFFELFFRPVLVEDGKAPLFTGYFEPELDGSLSPDARYRFPIYKMPREAKSKSIWLSRREIETSDVMRGRGLEIVWVDDAVELFFLQIQGSG